MTLTSILILFAIGGIMIMAKRATQISDKDALRYLRTGALVIDVRSREEFNSGHLACATNVPLDKLETVVPNRVHDKGQVLLLHCASGMRSGMAQGKLKSMGYAKVFNLGSYGRAQQILASSNQH